MQRQCEASATARRENEVLPDLILPSRSLSYAKTMQTSGKGACSYFPECSLSSTKTMRGECNSKTVKRSFTGLDTAEPKLVFYKDNVIFITTQTKPSIISFFHNKLSIKVYARCVFVESTVRIWHHSNTHPVSLSVPPRDILPNEQPCRRQLKKIPFRSCMI